MEVAACGLELCGGGDDDGAGGGDCALAQQKDTVHAA